MLENLPGLLLMHFADGETDMDDHVFTHPRLGHVRQRNVLDDPAEVDAPFLNKGSSFSLMDSIFPGMAKHIAELIERRRSAHL